MNDGAIPLPPLFYQKSTRTVVADGCHLNRPIKQLIENKFDALTVEELYAENFPKMMGYFYQGVATKAN
jgi:hypothetical protein